MPPFHLVETQKRIRDAWCEFANEIDCDRDPTEHAQRLASLTKAFREKWPASHNGLTKTEKLIVKAYTAGLDRGLKACR